MPPWARSTTSTRIGEPARSYQDTAGLQPTITDPAVTNGDGRNWETGIGSRDRKPGTSVALVCIRVSQSAGEHSAKVAGLPVSCWTCRLAAVTAVIRSVPVPVIAVALATRNAAAAWSESMAQLSVIAW